MTDLSVFRDKEDPACWRVEDNDYENDGGCTLALFAGPDAEKRAREYFEWLQSRVVKPSAADARPDRPVRGS